MREACEAIRAAVAAGRRDLRPRRLRRRRDLRDRARRARAARARRATSSGTCRAGSRRATASAAETLGAARRRGLRARPDRRLRRSRRSTRWRRRARAGLEVVVTDHHRAGDELPGLPGRRPVRRLPVRRPVRHGRRLQARPRRCSAPTRRCSRATSTSSRSRRSPTSCRSSTRTARSRSPGLRALAHDAEAGAAGADARRRRRPGRGRRGRGRLPARAADQRRRPALPPAARRWSCCSPSDSEEADRLAQRLEELNRERQQVEDRILREAVAADRVVAGGAAPPPRLRRRGRGLARGRDRDRRLAARRALRPAGRPDRGRGAATGRAPAARSPASTCTPRSAPAPAHLERWGGHRAAAGLSIEPERRRGVRGGVRRRTPTRRSPTTTSRPSTRVDAIVPGDAARRSASARSWRGSRRSGSATRASRSLAAGVRARRARHGGGGQAPPLPRPRPSGRDAGSAIAFRLGSQLDRFRRVGRYDVAFRLQENRWNGTVAPQLVVRRIFDAPDALRAAPRLARRRSGSSTRRAARPTPPRCSPSWSWSTAGGACSSRSASARCSSSRRSPAPPNRLSQRSSE